MEEKKQTTNNFMSIKKTVKWIGQLGVVIAAFIGLTQIFAWVYPEKAQIESTAKFVAFEYPKSMIKDVAIYNISDSPFRETHLLQILPESVKNNSSVSADIYNTVNSLIERRNFALKNLLAVRSYWRFSIKNTGKKEAAEVKIHLSGYKGYFALNEKRDTETNAEFEDIVPVGNIRPQDEIIVEVWTTGDYVPDIAWKSVNITTPERAVNPVFINEIDKFGDDYGFNFWQIVSYLLWILIGSLLTWVFFTLRKERIIERQS